MGFVSLLQRLTKAPGVSGSEYAAAEVVAAELRSVCDTVEINDRGTVVGKINGMGPKILLDAHLDQVGFIVTDISDNGFVKFARCGSIDIRILSGLEVTVLGRENVYGVISSIPPHLADSKMEGIVKPVEDLAIDTGLSDDDCKRLISKGDRVVPNFKYMSLLGKEISSAALDDRSGVAVHIHALELIRENKDFTPNVTVTFSVQEEERGFGAATAAYEADADVAIAVDVSFAYTPGCEKSECGEIGKGPMIGVSPILSDPLKDELIALAKNMDMPFQKEIMAGRTSTHADEIAVCKTGVKTALISIPLKYMHTPVEVINIEDLENCSRLIASYCLKGKKIDSKLIKDDITEDAEISLSNDGEVIKEISDIFGVSGRENLVRDYIISCLPNDVNYRVDNIGNLIVEKKGKRKADKKLMLLAHMDEVGLIITYITDEGYLKFDTVGGISEAVLIGRTVTLENGIKGVIALKHIHQCSADAQAVIPSVEKLCIDIGAHSKSEAEKSVSLGSYAVFNSSFVEFGTNKNRIKAKALDDRLGCALMLELINSDLDYDTTFAFTTQEEVGARGALCATFSVNPSVAIIIETTTAGDICGVTGEKRACLLGEGPVVSYMDRGTVYDMNLYTLAMKLAKENSIKAQTKTLVAGGNDSSSVQRTGNGVRVLAVSLPCRYLHSPACVIDKTDICETKKLLRLLTTKFNEI